MKATVSDLITDIDGEPETIVRSSEEFAFLVQVLVGPAPLGGGESFSITVCSPEWLNRRCQSEGFVAGQHLVVVRSNDYSDEGLRRFVNRWVASVEGPDWPSIAAKLHQFGAWEFEDYMP
jgi:hypothetical protein